MAVTDLRQPPKQNSGPRELEQWLHNLWLYVSDLRDELESVSGSSAVTLSNLGSGSFSTSSTSLVDVDNLSIDFTATGRTVLIAMVSDGGIVDGTTESRIEIADSSGGTNSEASIAILRGSTVISHTEIRITVETTATENAIRCTTPGTILHLDTPAAGTYTYRVQAKVVNANDTLKIENYKLAAFGL